MRGGKQYQPADPSLATAADSELFVSQWGAATPLKRLNTSADLTELLTADVRRSAVLLFLHATPCMRKVEELGLQRAYRWAPPGWLTLAVADLAVVPPPLVDALRLPPCDTVTDVSRLLHEQAPMCGVGCAAAVLLARQPWARAAADSARAADVYTGAERVMLAPGMRGKPPVFVSEWCAASRPGPLSLARHPSQLPLAHLSFTYCCQVAPRLLPVGTRRAGVDLRDSQRARRRGHGFVA